MPWSVTLISTAPARAADGDGDAGARRGCTRRRSRAGWPAAVTSCASLPSTTSPQVAAAHQGDAAGGGEGAGAVEGLARRRASTGTGAGLGQRVGALQAGQVDELLHQPAEPAGLVLHAAGEAAYGRGVLAGVLQRLGEQRHRPDRGLELVADVGDEVAPDRLDPAGLGDVLDEQRDEPVAPTGASRTRTASGSRPSRDGASSSSASCALPLRRVSRTSRRSAATVSRSSRTTPSASAEALASTTPSSASSTATRDRQGVHEGGGRQRRRRGGRRRDGPTARRGRRSGAASRTAEQHARDQAERAGQHHHGGERRAAGRPGRLRAPTAGQLFTRRTAQVHAAGPVACGCGAGGPPTLRAMRDAYHDELDGISDVPGRDDQPRGLGDEPGHDRAARRRPQHRRDGDHGGRAGRRALPRRRGPRLRPAGPPAAGGQRPARDRDVAADGGRPRAHGRPRPARRQDRPAALPGSAVPPELRSTLLEMGHVARRSSPRPAASSPAATSSSPPSSRATTTSWTACTSGCSP